MSSSTYVSMLWAPDTPYLRSTTKKGTPVEPSAVVFPNVDVDSSAIKPCTAVDDPSRGDLIWLMHRATARLSEDFDAASREHGLRDLRDTLVLAVAGDGTPRTQIEMATMLGLDKSTLMSIIDRLEKLDLIVRTADPNNRRIRIPETTSSGQEILGRVLADRDRRMSETLSSFGSADEEQLRTLLRKITAAR